MLLRAPRSQPLGQRHGDAHPREPHGVRVRREQRRLTARPSREGARDHASCTIAAARSAVEARRFLTCHATRRWTTRPAWSTTISPSASGSQGSALSGTLATSATSCISAGGTSTPASGTPSTTALQLRQSR